MYVCCICSLLVGGHPGEGVRVCVPFDFREDGDREVDVSLGICEGGLRETMFPRFQIVASRRARAHATTGPGRACTKIATDRTSPPTPPPAKRERRKGKGA